MFEHFITLSCVKKYKLELHVIFVQLMIYHTSDNIDRSWGETEWLNVEFV